MTDKPTAYCNDCGVEYGSPWFPDLLVPHDIWNNHISPTNDEGGLLCPNCLCAAATAAGITCSALFVSGPFCTDWAIGHITLPAAIAQIAQLQGKLADMTRSRDKWRERIGGPGARIFSRSLWAGMAADHGPSAVYARAAWLAFCDATTDTDWFAAVAALDAALGTEGRDHD